MDNCKVYFTHEDARGFTHEFEACFGPPEPDIGIFHPYLDELYSETAPKQVFDEEYEELESLAWEAYDLCGSAIEAASEDAGIAKREWRNGY